MKKSWVKKGLVLGIILLFIGTSVLPFETSKEILQTNSINQIEMSYECKNIVGIADEFSFNYMSYTEHAPIYIEGNENFNEENGVTAGEGIIEDPYVIQGWEIDCETYDGIVIINTSIYFIIKNCYIHNGSMNTDGIVFYNVTNGIIDYNLIQRNRNGVMFQPQFPGKENSNNNIISNNSIEYNMNDGISFEHTGSDWHSMNRIFSNNIVHNTRGIYMVMSAENTISYNNIISNDDYGIELDRCMGGGELNIIHHNNIVDNKGEKGQVLDWGDPLNYWNDSYPSGGNFWSDYNGTDNYQGPNQDIQGSDGIGDVPYDVPEGTNQDKYPLMKPWNISNDPPDKPNQPSGETNGKIGRQYFYTTNTTDPDGDQVYYLWDWGDGSTSIWFGPYDSGITFNTHHNWTIKGSYSIKVKAKDIYGNESVWSDPLPITMPFSYHMTLLQLLQRFFQRFPHTFPILRQLLRY